MADTAEPRRPARPSATDLAVGSGAAVTGAEIANLVPEPYKPLAAIVGTGLVWGWNRIRDRNLERLTATAARALDTDAEGILVAIQDDPTLLVFAVEVFEAVSRTANEQKVDALARIWAQNLGDDARPDEDLMMLRAVAELETPHIRLLGWLVADPKVHSLAEIRESLPHLSAVARGVVGALDRVGFTNQAMISGDHEGLLANEMGFSASDWGRLAMRYLDAWAAQAAGDGSE